MTRLMSFDAALLRKVADQFGMLDHGPRQEMIRQFEKLDPKLQAIYFWTAAYSYFRFGQSLLITSIYRKGAGVHSLWRGLDFDVDDAGAYGGLLPVDARKLVDAVNKNFRYDLARPNLNVAVYDLRGDRGKRWGNHLDHIHLQVYDNTIFEGVL